MQKKIALLHRYPADQIKSTNAAFPYLQAKGIEVLTFKKFDRLKGKFWKNFLWFFYAPMLVAGKGYDVIYCDDSLPIYPLFVKLASPKSKLVLRLGDLHLMYHTSGWLYKFLHFFEKLTWRVADQILCISQEMTKFVFFETNCRPFTVLDPVDPKDFPNRALRCSGSVMFHGTLTKNKNVDILLEAARRMPKVEFEIVGGGPDLKRLMKLAPRNVFFHGWVPFYQVCDIISTCAVGVALRSDNPGNEYVVTSPFIQYGVMGKPCLVTRRKVFRDYEWQFSGVDEMVEKLKLLFVVHQQEGKKLQEYILTNHSAQKIAEEIWSKLQ